MENKYYTPDIEEFCIGFEYEQFVKTIYISDLQWVKLKIGPLNFIVPPDKETLIKYFRVKYLDKEDFESLGFIHTIGDSFNYKTNVYTNEQIIISENPNKLLSNNYIIERNLNAFFSEMPEILFQGIIKNKHELKKLLKQLNIK